MTATRRTSRLVLAILITAVIYMLWLPQQGGSHRPHSAFADLLEANGELVVVSKDDPRWDSAVGVVFFTNDRHAFPHIPFPTTEDITRRFSVNLDDRRARSPDAETLQRLRMEMRSVMQAEGRDASDLDAVLLPDHVTTRPIWWGIIGNIAVLCLIVWLIGRCIEAIQKASHSSHRKRALSRGVCPSCGYNIRHLPQPRCPECGETWEPDEVTKEPQANRE